VHRAAELARIGIVGACRFRSTQGTGGNDSPRLARRDLKPLGASPQFITNVEFLTPVPEAPEPEACAAADKTLAARPGCGETGVIPDDRGSG
jgi:hypothetical protein